MVAAESVFDIPEQDEIHLVSLRKYNPTKDRPWWERLYLRLVFLPVVRFGFTRMHITAPSAMRLDGTIVFIEQQGVYLDEKTAQEACHNENYYVKPLPLNTELPEASVQYKGHHAPRSILPDRYRRRYFPLVPTSTHQLAQVKKNLEAISRTATGHG